MKEALRAYGVIEVAPGEPCVAARIGGQIVDLRGLQADGVIASAGLTEDVFAAPSLNRFMALGADVWREVDDRVVELSHAGFPPQAVVRDGTRTAGVEAADPGRDAGRDVTTLLPFEVADYCDFYASESHVSNMGKILRPGTDPLPPAWRHIPIGYHGRAGTVVASGTPIRRPIGVVSGPDPASEQNGPRREPSSRLDLEVELGFVVGTPSIYGEPVPVDDAREHIFGVVVVNDWSARDIQAFEYQPLGPFLGKSFATSISTWVVPLSALDEYRTDGPEQGTEVPYNLVSKQPRALDIHFELSINSTVLSRPEARVARWSLEQFVTHLTSNGATLRTGDLLASGTLSGEDPGTFGSMMELAWGGTKPVRLDDGSVRVWLEDGDEVSIGAWCGGSAGNALELGTVMGVVTGASPGD
ncbi:MAG: fumarylacetoacetate hydrolase family protein [Acidimicrobiales bacterium]